MSSGNFMCMAPPPMDDTQPEGSGNKGWRASQGELGSQNGHQPEPVQNSSAALVAQRPEGDPRGSTEPTVGARQTLRTMWFRRQVRAKPYKSLHILHIACRRENWSPNGSRQTLRAVWFRGHERLLACHAATTLWHLLQRCQNSVE